MTNQTQERNFGTIKDAAARANRGNGQGVSTATMRRWIASGLVYAEKIGPKLIRIDLDTVDALGTPMQYRRPRTQADRDWARGAIDNFIYPEEHLSDAPKDHPNSITYPDPGGESAVHNLTTAAC